MKRPNPTTYLFGNPIIALASGLGAIVLAYQGWTGAVSPVVALIAVGIAIYAWSAYQHLEKYRLWKLEWDSMSGQSRSSGRGQSLARHPAIRFIVGGAIWCVMAYGAMTVANQPDMQVVAGLFWLGTFALISVHVFRLVRRKSKARPKPVRDIPVSLCLPVPRQSPDAAQALSALPAYCLPLFNSPERKSATVQRR